MREVVTVRKGGKLELMREVLAVYRTVYRARGQVGDGPDEAFLGMLETVRAAHGPYPLALR